MSEHDAHTEAAQPAGLRDMRIDTILGTLGIEIVDADATRVVLRMPVSDLVRDFWGVLQTSALVALAETAASVGAMIAGGPGFQTFGAEINASCMRELRDGVVEAVSIPLNREGELVVWETTITDGDGNLVCRSRCTVSVRPLQHPAR